MMLMISISLAIEFSFSSSELDLEIIDDNLLKVPECRLERLKRSKLISTKFLVANKICSIPVDKTLVSAKESGK